MIMTEVMFIRGEPCVRCTGEEQRPTGTVRKLCEDHFRDVAIAYFARRKHPDPVEAATSAMKGGLQIASAPMNQNAHSSGLASDLTRLDRERESGRISGR
ncbi:hypothetical protein [Streptomyces sp. NPDC005799]|uniref:hypothetical protein n=1 Tax=Streptomyces sp. NPDC005799 TaxID=3154678 RepID=UPI0033C5EC2A